MLKIASHAWARTGAGIFGNPDRMDRQTDGGLLISGGS